MPKYHQRTPRSPRADNDRVEGPGSSRFLFFRSTVALLLAGGVVSSLLREIRLASSATSYTSFHSSVNIQAVNSPPPIPKQSSTLPTCKSLMQDPESPYRNGDFLTRRTIPIHWKPRVDHSRELHHSMCTLHRYTAAEARQCLAGKHLSMIGDSLTRYQYLSLAYFLHKGKWPPRFERANGACKHQNEQGQPVCSTKDEPNVCMENDWMGVDFGGTDDGTNKDSWSRLMQTMGGPRYFDGYMESNAIRKVATPFAQIVENYFYASPPAANAEKEKRTFLSYNQELGWNENPTPIHGFAYTGCAFRGDCTYSDELMEERLKRSGEMNFDFSQPLEEALDPDNGALRKLLPPVDIVLYNRGLWGHLDKDRAEKIFPLLHKFSQGEKGRCYWRATNPKWGLHFPNEPLDIRHVAFKNGCGYIDHAHLVGDFTQMVWSKDAPGQEYGNIHDEKRFIYWDASHFKPWVYEELNNVLLNVLCNNADYEWNDKETS